MWDSLYEWPFVKIYITPFINTIKGNRGYYLYDWTLFLVHSMFNKICGNIIGTNYLLTFNGENINLYEYKNSLGEQVIYS